MEDAVRVKWQYALAMAFVDLDHVQVIYEFARNRYRWRRGQRRRGYWTRPWILRRRQFGLYDQLLVELRNEDQKAFRNFMRMPTEMYDEILARVEHRIQRQYTFFREPLPAGLKLSATLRHLASGAKYSDMQYAWRVPDCTLSHVVREVCQAICDEYSAEVMTPPTTPIQWRPIAEGFMRRWNFPHTLAAIDGKHVAIKKPQKSGSLYHNYKGFFSVILLAMVDHDYKFIWCDVGGYGSSGDAKIYNESEIAQAVQDDALGFPDPDPLPHDDEDTPYFFIGDDAFSLTKNFQKPFAHRGLTYEERIYNYRLSRARRIVENAFGILANRFQECINRNTEDDTMHIPRKIVKQTERFAPVLRDTIGNYEPVDVRLDRTGPGEYGRPVNLDPTETEKYEQSYKEYGFNMIISDRISLDRAIPDIRDTQCRNWHYPMKLPNTSVVVVFHNEGWSTLVRTIHSIMNTSPAQLLHEILMVDDFSDKEHLKERLEDYIRNPKFQGKVRLIRNSRREGLIRSRTKGAKYSTGEVVTFLDAHCECGTNWLPPLLAEIAANRSTVVCPTVDAIEAEDFSYGPQLDGLCRGAFDWDFWYKRIPVATTRDRIGMKYRSQAYRSPVMAGGLFAIDRKYFFELGGYDPGLQIWGGENFEISFKIWMCGGILKFVPCSRVGHIYRKGVPYSYPETGVEGVSIIQMNYMRVAEVWLDEYKDYFYADKPYLRDKPCGDTEGQVKFRKEKCPHTFKWFMHEIAFDTLHKFPPPSPNRVWGEIRALDSDLCIDTLAREKRGGPIGVSPCHGMGGNQRFRMNMIGEIAIYDYCLYPVSTEIRIRMCQKGQVNGPSNAVWEYNEDNNTIRVKKTNHCLDHDSTNYEVFLSPCDYIKSSQRFVMRQPKS